MTQYYECHITFEGDPVVGKVSVEEEKWKYSRIDGDPVMGEGVRQYATMHYSEQRYTTTQIWGMMQKIRERLEFFGIKVTRCKIELVLRDERY